MLEGVVGKYVEARMRAICE
ncbi:MAG: hypothetical protein ABSB63_01710 [Spirochaetia bacterium]